MAPTTRFVLWLREPRAWAASFVRFFANVSEPWLRLAYGVCSLSRPEEAVSLLATAMARHVAEIRGYFEAPDAPPSRRARLMLVRDIDAKGLEHELCTFVLDGTVGTSSASSDNESASEGAEYKSTRINATRNATRRRCGRLLGGHDALFPRVMPSPPGGTAFKSKYNLPLGKPENIRAWRGCVHRAIASTAREPRAENAVLSFPVALGR